MPIPSPDDILIAASERIAAPAQDRGVTLAALRAPLPFAQPIGAFLLAAMILSLSKSTEFLSVGGLFAFIGAVDAMTALAQSRKLRNDARAWNPAIAARYRSEAVVARSRGVVNRLATLVLVIASVMLVGVAVSTGLPLVVLGSCGFVFWTGGRLAETCAECLIPRDPDLAARRSPLPASA